MQKIEEAVSKHFPKNDTDLNINSFVPVKSIPLFLNNVFHELGYSTINVNQEEAHQIFQIIDQNDDKVITKDEIVKGLMKILNKNQHQQKPHSTWSTITQVPNYNTKPKTQASNQHINQLFIKYDPNKLGFIDKSQLLVFMNQYIKLQGKNHQFENDDQQKILNSLSSNHDGKISKDQIKNILENVASFSELQL